MQKHDEEDTVSSFQVTIMNMVTLGIHLHYLYAEMSVWIFLKWILCCNLFSPLTS